MGLPRSSRACRSMGYPVCRQVRSSPARGILCLGCGNMSAFTGLLRAKTSGCCVYVCLSSRVLFKVQRVLQQTSWGEDTQDLQHTQQPRKTPCFCPSLVKHLQGVLLLAAPIGRGCSGAYVCRLELLHGSGSLLVCMHGEAGAAGLGMDVVEHCSGWPQAWTTCAT